MIQNEKKISFYFFVNFENANKMMANKEKTRLKDPNLDKGVLKNKSPSKQRGICLKAPIKVKVVAEVTLNAQNAVNDTVIPLIKFEIISIQKRDPLSMIFSFFFFFVKYLKIEKKK